MGGVLRHDDVERTMLLSVLADDLCVGDIDEDARRTLYREYVDLDRVLSRRQRASRESRDPAVRTALRGPPEIQRN